MKMDRKKFEQCCAIKFCVKLGESATVSYEKIQRGYGEYSLSRSQVFRWHMSFLEGQEQVEDEPRAGRPSTSKADGNVERVRSLVRSDRRWTLRIISSELNLNWFTVHQILTQDLDVRKVCTKMVPKNLVTEQKASRRDVCLDLLDHLAREPEFFGHVITGDESWILEYDPETKRQSWEWHIANSPCPKKGSSTRNLCHQDKLSIKLFIVKSLKDSGKMVAHVRPGIARTWMLHHDNARCHMAVSINELLAGKSIHVVPQPPYSPDLSPCDFFLFPQLKNHLRAPFWYFG